MPARPFQRCAFVAVTTADLAVARAFWVNALGCRVVRQKRGEFLMVDAGGVRLCLDRADGAVHKLGSSDPVIGLKVASLPRALDALRKRGVRPFKEAGSFAELRDPDGRTVVLTETD